MSSPGSPTLRDETVGIRIKISALWVATLFLFAYGDIYAFYVSGQIDEIRGGHVSGIEVTQAFLVAVSVYIAIASVMIYLTLVIRPAVNRWVNAVVALLYVGSIVASAVDDSSEYFLFLSAVETALLLMIVWHSWTWPRQEAGSAEER